MTFFFSFFYLLPHIKEQKCHQSSYSIRRFSVIYFRVRIFGLKAFILFGSLWIFVVYSSRLVRFCDTRISSNFLLNSLHCGNDLCWNLHSYRSGMLQSLKNHSIWSNALDSMNQLITKNEKVSFVTGDFQMGITVNSSKYFMNVECIKNADLLFYNAHFNGIIFVIQEMPVNRLREANFLSLSNW